MIYHPGFNYSEGDEPVALQVTRTEKLALYKHVHLGRSLMLIASANTVTALVEIAARKMHSSEGLAIIAVRRDARGDFVWPIDVTVDMANEVVEWSEQDYSRVTSFFLTSEQMKGEEEINVTA